LAQTYNEHLTTAWYYDLHSSTETTAATAACGPQVTVVCQADLPPLELDLFAMPVLKRGEAELTRDILQQGHERLKQGGTMMVSVDNPQDRWLHEQMQVMFSKVTSLRLDRGCVYIALKDKPLKKVKDFSCQYAFRDADRRLIQVCSRPSVFSHRRLDPGARQLLLAAEVGPQDRVLDMGCGAGAIALAAAFQTQERVYAVDANARAVACTLKGVELNTLTNVEVILNANGQLELPAPVDLALANPPYFGDDRISKHFVDTCLQNLRTGGALLVVTKKPRWYEAYFEDLLDDVLVFESSAYHIACGRKP
jgi:16S rRNA (guanine1207-N2)-methyltransferase